MKGHSTAGKHPSNWLYARASRNLKELDRRFPLQFVDKDIDRSWPDGWNLIVTKVCESVDQSKLNASWTQIKEKFGGLRMYYTGAPPRLDIISEGGLITGRIREESDSQAESRNSSIRKIVEEAEQNSLRTCCKCGSAGAQQLVERWLYTICNECLSSFVERRRSYEKFIGSRLL